jgi:hypothetical protein
MNIDELLQELKQKRKESKERIDKLTINHRSIEQAILDIKANMKLIYSNLDKSGISVPWNIQETDVIGPLDEKLLEIRVIIAGEKGCYQALDYTINQLSMIHNEEPQEVMI